LNRQHHEPNAVAPTRHLVTLLHHPSSDFRAGLKIYGSRGTFPKVIATERTIV
jgi:hypothetical protein